MNHESHSAVTLSRLLAVDWDSDFMISLGHARSRARLMSEYLRRTAWWVNELDDTRQWPFFDIVGRWGGPGVDLARREQWNAHWR